MEISRKLEMSRFSTPFPSYTPQPKKEDTKKKKKKKEENIDGDQNESEEEENNKSEDDGFDGKLLENVDVGINEGGNGRMENEEGRRSVNFDVEGPRDSANLSTPYSHLVLLSSFSPLPFSILLFFSPSSPLLLSFLLLFFSASLLHPSFLLLSSQSHNILGPITHSRTTN